MQNHGPGRTLPSNTPDDYGKVPVVVDDTASQTGVALQPTSSVVSKTATYTASWGDVVLADGSGGAFAVTTPDADEAAAALTKEFTVLRTGATGTITVTAASGTINGASSVTLTTQYTGWRIVSDGTNFFALPNT